MNESEYRNILQHENSYWWYLILDDLVEHYVVKKFASLKIKFLDAGCGTGRVLSKLSKYGDGYGIDSSEIAVKMCLNRGLNNIEIADLNSWKSEVKFDCIISLDVLYHKSLNNFETILGSFYNALQKNGILILNLPAFNILKRQHDEVVGGNKRFIKSELKNALQKTGFFVEVLTYRYPLLFVFILLNKIFYPNNRKNSDLKSIHPLMNKALYLFHKIENGLIKSGLSIPFGSSVFVVAQKMSNSSDLPLNLSRNNIDQTKIQLNSSTKLSNQIFKYSFVGVFNTLIGLSVIFLLYNVFHFGYLFANAGGYAVGLLNSFIWNKWWTFQSSKHFSKEVIPFLIVFGISYLINLLVVIVCVELLRINPNHSQVLGIIAYSVVNFFINKYWTFSN